MSSIPLPQCVVDAAQGIGMPERHPGLQLDKFSATKDVSEDDKRKQLEHVVKCRPLKNEKYQSLFVRYTSVLKAMNPAEFTAKTTSPLALHLSRATALENAAICLHPIHGFVYLPGSGLKGMARAFAETIWLPLQKDPKAAWRKIEDVFGWAPNPDRKKQIESSHPAEKRYYPDNPKKEMKAHVGNIVFYDAWPTTVPSIEVDLLNSHHTKYYQGEDWPGDWEDPNLVPFLVASTGSKFNFVLAKRRPDVDDGLLDLASFWLAGALTHKGAGAKTNPGYGCFKLQDGVDPNVEETWQQALASTDIPLAESSFTIELVTPAFLAGANQKKEDCSLRSATVAGLLRWWWRTMHSGYMDKADLLALETAIFGSAQIGGAVRIQVEPISVKPPVLFDYKDGYRPRMGFAQDNHLLRPPQNSTQGLFYLSYGMDEISHGQRRQRFYTPPGSSWKISMTARDSTFNGRHLPAADVLSQAEMALHMLCAFGGVGSKSRNGFGSLADLPGFSAEALTQRAKEFRTLCGLNNELVENWAKTPSYETRIDDLEIGLPWQNIWFVLDTLGYCVQSYANRNAHKEIKKVMGLPRQIHGPRNDPMQHQTRHTHQKPKNLSCSKGERHASPVLLHLGKRQNGGYQLRIIAFDAPFLDNKNDRKNYYFGFTDHLVDEFKNLLNEISEPGQVAQFKAYPAGGGHHGHHHH